MAEMASRISMASRDVASSPPSSGGRVKRKRALVDEDIDHSLGKVAQLLCFVAALADYLGDLADTLERRALQRRRSGGDGVDLQGF